MRHLVFQNGMFFFSPGARVELSFVTWARGHIPIQRGQHSLSIFLIVSNTTCFCHHTQGFGNATKKCVWQKIPTEWVWIAATHICSTNIDTQFIKCLTQRLFQMFYRRNTWGPSCIHQKTHAYNYLLVRHMLIIIPSIGLYSCDQTKS